MKAEIITIGDEILIGQIVDTNSAWIAEQFNLHGVEIHQITSVHDDKEHIKNAIQEAEKNVDLVLLTGGLGPTKDDITKNVLAEYFNTKLVLHEPTLEHIRERFKRRNIDLNKLNREQALVPETCTVLPNKAGTAPGLWFDKNDTIVVSIPGVPFEMQYLVENEILPRLKKNGKTKAIYHRTVQTQGLPESMLAEKIEQWESALPQNIKLAYLPNPMSVRLRLSAMGSDVNQLKEQVEQEIESLKKIIPDHIFGYDRETLAEIIGENLKKSGRSLSIAESCTGGFISHLITSVPGSSEYFNGSVIAYSNAIKSNILNVSQSSLMEYGAVSEQVARDMVQGVKNVFNTDYAVATTGIAGPDGGTAEKPVGTIWIAISGKNETIAKKYVFGDNRERNIIRSSQTALQMLRHLILKEL